MRLVSAAENPIVVYPLEAPVRRLIPPDMDGL